MRLCIATIASVLVSIYLSVPGLAEGPNRPHDPGLLGMKLAAVGPSRAVLADLYERSRATCVRIPCVWANVEKQDPGAGESIYDWSSLESDPMMKFSRAKIISIDLTNPWADALASTNDTRYWKLAARFASAVAKRYAPRGVKFYHVAGEHHDRLDRTDWPHLLVERLRRLYPAIKGADEGCVVIGGNVSSGAEETVQALYDAGIKGFFDVLEIGAQSIDPLAGVDISQVVSARRVLERNADQDKLIFIGTGWGPDAARSEEEQAAIRKFLVNGFRNLRTPRSDYDPRWVLGALYCTMNGLVDEAGKPKGDLLDAFLSPIPPIEVVGEIKQEQPIFAYVPGRPYNVTVEAFNPMDQPIDSPSLALTAGDVKLSVVEEEAVAPSVINPVTRIARKFVVTFPEDAAGKLVTLAGQLSYRWNGADHYADCQVPVYVSPAVEVNILPARATASETRQIGMSVINYGQDETKMAISFEAPQGIHISPSIAEIEAGPMGLEAQVFSMSVDPGLPAGRHRVLVLREGAPAARFDVDVPAQAAMQSVQPGEDASGWKGAPIPFGDADMQAWVRFAWDEKCLYIAVESADPVHRQEYGGCEMWRGDSVQVAIDPLMDGALSESGGYRDDDHEFVFSWTETGPRAARLRGPGGVRPAGISTVGVGYRYGSDGKTRYQVSIPWSELAPFTPDRGKALGVAVVVNDVGDGLRRATWGGGIVGRKDPREFIPVTLGAGQE